MTEVDAHAPMSAQDSIHIAAPVEKVWASLTDIARWPEWQAPVSSATMDGELAPGTVFRWKAKGMGITSTLRDVEPPSRVSWTGDSLGMRAIHVWQLEPEGDGTRVTTMESMSGWLTRLVKLFSPRFLTQSMAESLQSLKRRAEQ
jgi:uncharacterized protein YndB with AHSA1/START domain